MSSVLIITEDIVKIQTLSGFLGRTFKLIYLAWLGFRLKLITAVLRPFGKVTVVCSDCFSPKADKVLYYGQLLAKMDYAKNRSYYLETVDNLLKDVDSDLFKTRLAIFLVYHYYIYADLYQKIIEEQRPDLLVTLSQSYHEQTARFIARLRRLRTLKLHFFTLIFINHYLKKFLLNREYKQKIKKFLSQTKITPPDSKELKEASFLSLDFFRHLKTLMPIYQRLEKQAKNPWLVTDISSLSQILKSHHCSGARTLYLASFLPKPSRQFGSKKTLKRIKLSPVNNLRSFLLRLSLQAARPIIEHSLILADLYLQAGENLFKLAQPRGVLVVSDVRFAELSLSFLAKKHQLKSVMVSPNSLLDSAQLNQYQTTDIVSVVGDYVKNELIKIHVPKEKIRVWGDPRWESYQKLLAQFDRQAVYQKLGINSLNSRIILLISFRSNWLIPEQEKQAFFNMSVKAVQRLKNAVLVVKPHPTEKREQVLEELRQWGIAKKVILADNEEITLAELLQASSLVLETWSMTMFEAIMFNRPVICVNPFRKNYGKFLPILKEGGGIEVSSQSTLNRWLKILLDPEHPLTQKQLTLARSACAKFIKPPDGKVAKRVVSYFD
jgi:hypothetical protein